MNLFRVVMFSVCTLYSFWKVHKSFQPFSYIPGLLRNALFLLESNGRSSLSF